MLEITMKVNGSITFEEGYNLYIQNCKERNLRDDTIRHCRQSWFSQSPLSTTQRVEQKDRFEELIVN